MMSALEERRRRAQYRAAHRGTLEMDWLLGRYAAAALPAMPQAELDRFEGLLTLPDPSCTRGSRRVRVWLKANMQL
jgi:antitoxin CptB